MTRPVSHETACWPALALLACLLAGPLAAQSGTSYRPTLSPLSYGLTKAAVGGSVYLVAREIGLSRHVAALTAVVGPLVLGKAIAWSQGHRVPPLDVLHDAAWFSLLVLPVASRPRWLGVTVSVGVLVATCRASSPRVC